MKRISAVALQILAVSFPAANLSAQPAAAGIQISVLNGSHLTSIRAMAAVNDSVVWVGGSGGCVGKTTDGGRTWHWMRPGGVQLDFRSLAAADARHAVVAGAGAPAAVFLTDDGGTHWEKVYYNADTAIFLDGMVFRNKKEGLIYGDPVHGRFFILKTKDGGRHWKALPVRRRPEAGPGETSFAAGNSAIAVLPHTRLVWIGTGGKAARVLFSGNFGKRWKTFDTPMLQGKGSAGIFSLAFIDKDRGVCVGGDYTADGTRYGNAVLTENGGKSWQKPVINPFGYRSCVVYYAPDTLIATGTSGTDISSDGGVTWQRVSSQGFNVACKAREGTALFMAGAAGRIVRLSFSTKYAGK